MPEYTPGPWRIGFEDGTGWMDDEEGGWIIGADEEVVVVGGSHEGLKYGIPDEHNGLLIAAAPELLLVAKGTRDLFAGLAPLMSALDETYGPKFATMTKTLLDVIAKAEGTGPWNED